MSITAVKQILDRAHKDKKFRQLLLEEPLQALKDFDLTEEEIAKFKNIRNETLQAYKRNLETRYNKDGSLAAASSDDDWWVVSISD